MGKLSAISEESGGLPLALLCFEDVQKGEWCHRTALASWLGGHGIEVPELERGMLPRAQESDDPELRLFG